MLGFFELCFRDAVVHDACPDSDVCGMVADLQAPYRDTAIELPVNGKIHHRPAVVASLGLFQQANELHRLNLRRTSQSPMFIVAR